MVAEVTTNISIKDLDAFKDLSQILLTFMSDERIDEDIRNEYMNESKKVLGIKNPTEKRWN